MRKFEHVEENWIVFLGFSEVGRLGIEERHKVVLIAHGCKIQKHPKDQSSNFP
jgi:hypothetical protein